MNESKLKFRDLTTKKKIEYIWDYYKAPIIITIVLIFAVTSFVHGRLTAKTTIFRLAMIGSNVTELAQENLMDGFYYTCPGFNPDKEQMILDANYDLDDPGLGAYTTQTRLLAEYSAGTIDATIASEETIKALAESQAFADLSEALPEDLMSEIENRNIELIYNEYEDPATGELHKYPAAVNISGSSVIRSGFTESTGDTLPYYDGDCFYGICPNSSNLENSIEFLKYLLDPDNP